MLVRIKSTIDKDSWYSDIIGHTLHLIDLGNPLYLFATLDFNLPVFKLDIEILEDAKERLRKAS